MVPIIATLELNPCFVSCTPILLPSLRSTLDTKAVISRCVMSALSEILSVKAQGKMNPRGSIDFSADEKAVSTAFCEALNLSS